MKLTASVLLLLFNLLEIRDGYSLSPISDTTIQNRSNEHTFLPIKDLDHDLDTRSFEAVLESHFNALQNFKQRKDKPKSPK